MIAIGHDIIVTKRCENIVVIRQSGLTIIELELELGPYFWTVPLQ